MKIEVNMKTPDAVYNVTRDAVRENDPTPEELEEYEGDIDAWRSAKSEELEGFLAKWFHYGEGLTIEFDTETEAVTVLEV